MRNLYSVEFEQFNRDGIPYNSGSQDVLARTAEEAIRKARAREKVNGYLKSQPIEAKEVKLIRRDVR